MRILFISMMFLFCPLALAGPININTATLEQLDEELQGIGTALARRIVDYREAHGPFRSPEDIQKVPYVGVKTFQKNRALILVAD